MERELKDFKGANNAHEERMCLIKRVMRDDNTIQYYHFIPTPPCAAFFLLIMCLCEGGLIISCRHYIALKILSGVSCVRHDVVRNPKSSTSYCVLYFRKT